VDDLVLITGRGKRFSCSPECPDWIWDPPSLLFDGYWRLCSWG